MNNSANEAENPRTPNQKPMTLDEARKVMWLSSHRRPLGELFDEGYLDQSRLEWAAAKAYNPRLQQAAQVLLDWQKRATQAPAATTLPSESTRIPFSIGDSLEEARAMLWPFRPYESQPIGMLVETRRLTLRDLWYAIENARDKRVRHAATALMLVRLEQAVQEPEPPQGFLHVVSGGRSFSVRRQFFWTLVQGFIMGFPLGALLVLLIVDISRTSSTVSNKPLPNLLGSPVGIVALLIIVGLFLLALWLPRFLLDQILKRIDKRIKNYRKGQEGEERVVTAIQQALDGNWFLFRNIVLPGRQKGDLDSVLVGPPGVWVLEIKAFTGEHRNIGEHWEYRAGSRWKLLKSSPSRQAQNNAIRLSTFLKADNIQQWISPAVIWANPASPLTVENPSVAVWSLDRLPDELGNIWHGKTISEDIREQIVQKLTKLCAKQEEALNN
jgi:hypothetical protein